jgi:hypothetical protein
MKTIEYIIKKVAEKNNVDEKLVDKIIRHHWRKDIKKEMVLMNHTSIYLRYIGTITYSKIRVRQQIFKLIHKIKRVRSSDKYTEEKREQILTNYFIYLRKLLHQRNILALNYVERGNVIKNKRISKIASISNEESRTSDSGLDK